MATHALKGDTGKTWCGRQMGVTAHSGSRRDDGGLSDAVTCRKCLVKFAEYEQRTSRREDA